MDASGFLRLVWPDSGLYIIATPATTGYIHHIFEDIDSAAKAAESMDRQGRNVYFGVATAKSRGITDVEGKVHYRTKANMASIRTFYAEMDVAKPGEWDTLSAERQAGKHETREAAIAALKQFCTSIGWPLPTLVSSGWGWHCYWLIEEVIPATIYEEVAALLKRTAKALKFKLDPAALNITQVFRVVGTHNHKRADDIQPVEMVKCGKRSDHSALLSSLRRVAESLGVEAKPAKESIPDYLNFGESNTSKQYQSTPAAFDALRQCGAVSGVEAANGNVPYEQWWRVGQLMRFVEDGREHYHRISRGGSSYDEETTDAVLDRFEHNDVGPTLCDTMAASVEACSTCPHFGKIKSPIVLGRQIQSEPVVVETPADELFAIPAVKVTLPPVPHPYACNSKGVFVAIQNSDGDASVIKISPYPILPSRRVFQERTKTEAMVWTAVLPMDGAVEFSMPSAETYDSKTLVTRLANEGVYIDYGNLSHVRDYMLAYMQDIQAFAARQQRYSHLGWRDSHYQFVLGDRLFDRGTPKPCTVDSKNRIMPAIKESGSLETWKSVFDLYNHPSFLPHQFALATAFGSPLLSFTGVTGGVINLLGRSGEGKSTIQKIVNSVWGHPLTLMLPAEDRGSTINAKMSVLALMHNLPVCAEEITQVPAKELGSLLYCVSEGVNKIRVERDGTLKEDGGTWCLTMLASSNSAIEEKLITEEGAIAKLNRVLEYRLPMVKLYDKTTFREQVDRPLLTNYGLAGPIYAAYLTAHADKIDALVQSVMKKLEHATEALAEERIWIAIAAANLAGFMLAQKCGLHSMATDPLFDFIVNQIKRMRGKSADLRYSAEETLAEYLNSNLRNILVVESPEHGVKHTRILKDPLGSICARYDVANGHMWVATGPFKEWCLKNGRVFSEVVTGLIESETLLDRKCTKVLGANTHYASGQVRCIVVNSTSYAFSGVAPKELPEAKIIQLPVKGN